MITKRKTDIVTIKRYFYIQRDKEFPGQWFNNSKRILREKRGEKNKQFRLENTNTFTSMTLAQQRADI